MWGEPSVHHVTQADWSAKLMFPHDSLNLVWDTAGHAKHTRTHTRALQESVHVHINMHMYLNMGENLNVHINTRTWPSKAKGAAWVYCCMWK